MLNYSDIPADLWQDREKLLKIVDDALAGGFDANALALKLVVRGVEAFAELESLDEKAREKVVYLFEYLLVEQDNARRLFEETLREQGTELLRAVMEAHGAESFSYGLVRSLLQSAYDIWGIVGLVRARDAIVQFYWDKAQAVPSSKTWGGWQEWIRECIDSVYDAPLRIIQPPDELREYVDIAGFHPLKSVGRTALRFGASDVLEGVIDAGESSVEDERSYLNHLVELSSRIYDGDTDAIEEWKEIFGLEDWEDVSDAIIDNALYQVVASAWENVLFVYRSLSRVFTKGEPQLPLPEKIAEVLQRKALPFLQESPVYRLPDWCWQYYEKPEEVRKKRENAVARIVGWLIASGREVGWRKILGELSYSAKTWVPYILNEHADSVPLSFEEKRDLLLALWDYLEPEGWEDADDEEEEVVLVFAELAGEWGVVEWLEKSDNYWPYYYVLSTFAENYKGQRSVEEFLAHVLPHLPKMWAYAGDEEMEKFMERFKEHIPEPLADLLDSIGQDEDAEAFWNGVWRPEHLEDEEREELVKILVKLFTEGDEAVESLIDFATRRPEAVINLMVAFWLTGYESLIRSVPLRAPWLVETVRRMRNEVVNVVDNLILAQYDLFDAWMASVMASQGDASL